MLAKVLSSAVVGVDAALVEVEVDIAAGLPAFTTVGLPDASVKESRDRVKSAIRNSGYGFPDDRITVNLAPADIKKDGTGFDLPMALGILAATGIIPVDTTDDFLVLGELSLDGRVKPVKGSLPMAIEAQKAGYSGILVPFDNRKETAVVKGIDVYPVRNLSQAVGFLRGFTEILPEPSGVGAMEYMHSRNDVDFSEVMGQEHVKRAMEVAAAGNHNILMNGPPGSGKTMLAQSFSTILPPLTFDEAIETTKIYSVSGKLDKNQALISRRPFRSPHHTVSDAGLIGGGHYPKPGEVSLAHNGVLFLDELPEFKKHVLEVMRQPLEDRRVTISRAASTLTYPANFTLIAAMNPCPCGYLTDRAHPCRCTPAQVQKYITKVSGPLMDRIDIHIEVPAVPFREMKKGLAGEDSAVIRERVYSARQIQAERYRGQGIYCNAQMSNRMLETNCRLDNVSMDLLEKAILKLGMSARAFNRVIKISRTIADLAGDKEIRPAHVSEAIQYRTIDRYAVNG